MKISIAGLALMSLAVVAGCTQGTPGGPGTADTAGTKPAYGQANDTFNLSVPYTSTSLQQGEQMEATIGIKRAENFDEDVSLQLVDVPEGVTVEPANPVIRHGDTDAKLTFKAADEAPLGEFKIKITGHPTTGGDAQIEFKLAIAPKDSFTLGLPRQATLKQGETQTVSISITRAKNFDQDVGLAFGHMPTGITLEPASPVIKHGDANAQITLTAADDAALGNFDIKVTGHPAKGAEASHDLKLVVVKQ